MSEEFRPSDFKDLIDVALVLIADSYRCIENSASLSNLDRGASSQLEKKRAMDQESTRIAKVLIRRHRDLDTHYGWVLASDRTCIGRVIREYCEVSRGTEAWFEEMLERLGATRVAMDGVVEAYESALCARCARCG